MAPVTEHEIVAHVPTARIASYISFDRIHACNAVVASGLEGRAKRWGR